MQLWKLLKDIIFNMKKSINLLVIVFFIISCGHKQISNSQNSIKGTWKMVYAKIIENDSIKLKDLSKTTFVKIINDSHFSFFNQENTGNKNFYSGAGTYNIKERSYIEKLEFTSVETIKGHEFLFQIEIKGDTLIQSGIEKIEAAGINRQIVEKYIKLN